MARNRLQERDNNLPNVEYEVLLKEILAMFKKHTDTFQISDSVLQIRVDRIALEVTNKLKGTNVADVCPFIYSRGLTHVTANFLDGRHLMCSVCSSNASRNNSLAILKHL